MQCILNINIFSSWIKCPGNFTNADVSDFSQFTSGFGSNQFCNVDIFSIIVNTGDDEIIDGFDNYTVLCEYSWSSRMVWNKYH